MYIEFVILDNFMLTFIAGALASRLCGKRASAVRLIVGSLVGTGVAVFYPFIRIGDLYLMLIKLALWVLLSFVMYFKTARPILSCVMFLGCTFALGGVCYAIDLSLFSFGIFGKCPIFATLGVGAAVYAVTRLIIKRLRLVRSRSPYNFKAEVEIFGCTLDFDAFLDTGNAVFDDSTGLPVAITDFASFSSKLDGSATCEFLKKLDTFKKLTVSTHAGRASAYLIKPTKLTVYSDKLPHTIDAMVGVVGGSAFKGAHEMLFGPAAVSEGV